VKRRAQRAAQLLVEAAVLAPIVAVLMTCVVLEVAAEELRGRR
jgi:hypothetical protein